MSYYKVQSVLFEKELNTINRGINWLEEHNYKHYKVDEDNNYYRFRQLDPDELKREGYTMFRNITISKPQGIHYIMAYKPQLPKNVNR